MNVTLAATLLVAASGCSDTVDVGDVLELGQTTYHICVPAPDEGGTLFGDSMLRNTMDDPVTIESVALLEPKGMTIASAFLVQLGPDEPLVGIRHASDTDGLPARWPQRLNAESAVIEPDAEWNLVLVVDSSTDDDASASAARITYVDGRGKRFRQDTLTAMSVSSRPCEDVLSEESE